LPDKSLPEDEVLVYLLHGLVKVPAEFDFLPELSREGRSLHGLHVEEADAVLLSHCGVLGVSQGTGAPVTQPGQVVLIPTELLGLGLGLVLTESFVDDRPNDVVVLHCGLLQDPNPAVNVTMKITKMLFAGKAKH